MKRTMSMFAAVAALAVGFLFAAPAANAQNGTTQYFSQGGCTRAQSGNNSWPYSYGAYYCPGVTVAQHNGQRQVLFDLTAKAPALYNVLNTATAPVPGNRPGAQFYLMVDKTQYINIYNAQFGHNPPPAATPSDTAGGITAYNGNVPLYTVIFLKTKDPHGNVINNTFYQNTTIHEAGHWGDIYLAPIAGAGLVRASDAPLFQHGLNTDWGLFNPLTNCSTMVPSVFNGFQDPSGTWFCNGINGTGGSLQAPYTGLSNEAVLQAPTAFQEIFAVNKEIYAEANAILTGVVDGTTMGLDHFFTDGPAPGQGRFACTKLFVQKLIVNGRLPTAQELQHINCPTQ